MLHVKQDFYQIVSSFTNGIFNQELIVLGIDPFSESDPNKNGMFLLRICLYYNFLIKYGKIYEI